MGIHDPRVGLVELLFDRTTHRFLGEPIAGPVDQHKLSFNAAVQRTAVVDKVGRLP
ncbi:hypothetical protein [Kibdelosporangium banguiense]|uniref:hypothetical protein n=1 Tax=Kibdelosporangium banguiense TaxID=1365924 RepID=UPI001AEB9A10|nr:hypothetical protein [Kibdelosporangium banguiense]